MTARTRNTRAKISYPSFPYREAALYHSTPRTCDAEDAIYRDEAHAQMLKNNDLMLKMDRERNQRIVEPDESDRANHDLYSL